MQPYIIGSDIGTGSVKTVALDFDGKVICSTQVHYPTLHPQTGYSEQDPEIVVNAFFQSIKALIIKMKDQPEAVALSSAMHGLLVIDKDGKPITNLMLWSDARSNSIAGNLKRSAKGKIIYEASGTPIHSMSPLSKILWLKENDPDTFYKAYKFISIKEFIWQQLFREYVIDYSLASATGLLDIENRNWHSPSLTLASVSLSQLSQPVATTYVKKGVAVEKARIMGISPDTAFCIGASDGCLANLGTNAINNGVAAITIGTSGAVRIFSREPIREYEQMFFNYILDEEHFISGGPVNNGGNIIHWLIKNYLDIEDIRDHHYEELFNQIQSVPAGCDGLVFLPYVNGERAPVWDEESCGVFFGIRSQHKKQHFLRAVLEGICFGLNDILTALEEASEPIHQVNVSGGFVQSALWMQMLADITGKKVFLQQTEDASAVGAAYLGLKATGVIHEFPNVTHSGKMLIPRKTVADVYEKNFRVYKTLYPALKNSMTLLYKLEH